MDEDRLCAWLGLPPATWPPDHYALLSLSRGVGDLADIETRVLDRMEQLRAHQLLHPELVTQGMNRLAQALVCLTDPIARAAYDRSLGIPPLPFELVEDGSQPEDTSGPADTQQLEMPAALLETGSRSSGESGQPEPDPLPYKISPYEVVPDEPLPLPGALSPPLPPESPAATPGKQRPPAPINRRTVYRRLAALRKAIRAWDDLRPVFGTPTETLSTPVAVLLLVQALAAAREALPGVSRIIRGTGSPGGMVAAVVQLPHAIHAVRLLLPVQRQAVALDWRRGHQALHHERARLRQLARSARPRRPIDVGTRLLRAVRRAPEWIFPVLAAAVILLVLLRRKP